MSVRLLSPEKILVLLNFVIPVRKRNRNAPTLLLRIEKNLLITERTASKSLGSFKQIVSGASYSSIKRTSDNEGRRLIQLSKAARTLEEFSGWKPTSENLLQM